MSSGSADSLELALRYIAAVERGATGNDLAQFYAEDVIYHEFPNAIVPRGSRRTRSAMLEGAERGQKVMAAQTFEIRSAIATPERVALEIEWTGTLKIPYGPLAAGDQMRAHIAVFLEIKDGKIVAQRNYDCYEPWS